jgi:hypothetical protein
MSLITVAVVNANLAVAIVAALAYILPAPVPVRPSSRPPLTRGL